MSFVSHVVHASQIDLIDAQDWDYATCTQLHLSKHVTTEMPSSDDENYGDIADEDFIEALSQASQSLPLLQKDNNAKRRRGSGTTEDDEDDDNRATKKRKYRIHTSTREQPPAQIIGATQADGLPD
jgi:hypothetical protein